MNENAKKWVEALRSGDYRQTKATLRDEQGAHCCLGVACDVFIKETGEGAWNEFDQFVHPSLPRPEGLVLPDMVQDWLGLNGSEGEFGALPFDRTTLTRMNDKEGKTFDEIADIVESEPEGLFV